MEAGKPQKQALAIAYSMKRRKKMSKGGMVDCYSDGGEVEPTATPRIDPEKAKSVEDSFKGSMQESIIDKIRKAAGYSEGGVVESDNIPESIEQVPLPEDDEMFTASEGPDEHHDSPIQSILEKIRKRNLGW